MKMKINPKITEVLHKEIKFVRAEPDRISIYFTDNTYMDIIDEVDVFMFDHEGDRIWLNSSSN